MSQELEIEFKNILEEVEYRQLLTAFSISEDRKIIQENFYFDTPEFSLKGVGAALRIRKKNGICTLTLKQPVKRGLLETHQVLSKEEAEQMLNGGNIIEGEVASIIKGLSIEPLDVLFLAPLKRNEQKSNTKMGYLCWIRVTI